MLNELLVSVATRKTAASPTAGRRRDNNKKLSYRWQTADKPRDAGL